MCIAYGLPRQEPDLPDPITSPFAVWVCDALEVAYDQVRRHSGQAVQRQKRLYDRDRQVEDAARFSTTISWNPFVTIFESGINRSSHGNDPGSICVSGFLLSKACRPNESGESYKSKSTTPSEHKSFGSDLSSSWDTRILWRLSI